MLLEAKILKIFTNIDWKICSQMAQDLFLSMTFIFKVKYFDILFDLKYLMNCDRWGKD